MKIVEDIKRFIENDINLNNKFNIGGSYLCDDTETYTDIKVLFNTRHAENYKKLLAFLSTTDYILVRTEVYSYGCIIREYK